MTPETPTVRDPQCVFCGIIAGERTASVVMRDDVAMAFLDVKPLFVGHTLVVPIDHHVTLAELPVDQTGPFFARVQALSAVIPAELAAPGTCVAMNNIVSQSVPHLHAHVVPRRPKDGLRGFFWPRTDYDDRAHMDATAARLAAAWDAAGFTGP